MITFDAFDTRLLRALQENSRLTGLELSERVHLSPSQCQRRIHKLEEAGVIEQYTAVLNREKAGFAVAAIINVSLEKHGKFPSAEFQETIDRYPNILECWATTGDADYILKVVAEDLNAFTKFLMEDLLDLPIIASVRSSILLQQLKATTTLPVTRGRRD